MDDASQSMAEVDVRSEVYSTYLNERTPSREVLSRIIQARSSYHSALLSSILYYDGGIPSNADESSQDSVALSKGILERLESEVRTEFRKCDITKITGPNAREVFERMTAAFLEETFLQMQHLRPGTWQVSSGDGPQGIAQYEQYAYLLDLDRAVKQDPSLAVILGNDYIIRPDILIVRATETDDVINSTQTLVDADVAKHASLRESNGGKALLHASISCKWTLRSDRAQNARSEALNLIRSRKGRAPHIAIVTGEPTPARLASIALGTGDIDCVYHFALPELMAAVSENHADSTAEELLRIMVQGKRLKDIADLPLDLAI